MTLSEMGTVAGKISYPVFFLQIPKDVVAEMDTVAPMLRKLGYDPNGNPPNYGEPEKVVEEVSFLRFLSIHSHRRTGPEIPGAAPLNSKSDGHSIEFKSDSITIQILPFWAVSPFAQRIWRALAGF